MNHSFLLAVGATLALIMAVTALPAAPAAAAPAADPPVAVPDDDCDHRLGTPVSATAPAAAPVPVGVSPCPGVRPGAVVYIARPDLGRDRRAQCTLNFIYRGTAPDGRVTMYAGTAGHCVLESGERAWEGPEGPRATDPAGNRIGDVSYAVFSGVRDFALIRIAPGVRYNSQMCHFGGPLGVNNERTNATATLRHVGQGVGTSLVPARTSVARGTPDPDRVLAMGAVAPGDSGSPVLAPDGRAIAVVVTVGAHLAGSLLNPQTGTVGMTRVGPQLARAGKVLGQTMRIVQAPLR